MQNSEHDQNDKMSSNGKRDSESKKRNKTPTSHLSNESRGRASPTNDAISGRIEDLVGIIAKSIKSQNQDQSNASRSHQSSIASTKSNKKTAYCPSCEENFIESDADILMKTSLSSQFPAISTTEPSVESVVKLQQLTTEYEELKKSLNIVNGTMEQHFKETQQLRDDISEVKKNYETKMQEFQLEVEKLHNENVELKAEIVENYSTKAAEIDDIRKSLQKVEREQMVNSIEHKTEKEKDQLIDMNKNNIIISETHEPSHSSVSSSKKVKEPDNSKEMLSQYSGETVEKTTYRSTTPELKQTHSDIKLQIATDMASKVHTNRDSIRMQLMLLNRKLDNSSDFEMSDQTKLQAFLNSMQLETGNLLNDQDLFTATQKKQKTVTQLNVTQNPQINQKHNIQKQYEIKSLNDLHFRTELTFSYTVEHIDQLKSRHVSPPIYVGMLPWKIKLIPNNRAIGFFLQCNDDDKSQNWSCNAIFDMRLKCDKPDAKSVTTRRIEHLFNSKDNCYFAYFIELVELLNPNNGYVRDNSITVEVYLNAAAPQGFVSDSNLHTGFFSLNSNEKIN